ncbi:uncharacterized protein LOC101737693 [Bombyx mori]|uniref:Uncharacterized protein n=1 Tax=Bombyx mori TaxID=7091 RepID=A0A8R2C7J9_BOMMO|nr:uncharacterized protein LOC101737693 [Bombyx mori]XP_021205948.2 uncharacterized protein LOC101737693 [Bombyx mori]
MAIKTSLAVKDDPLVSLCSLDSSKAGNSNRLVKIDFATTNCKSKHWKSKKHSDSYKSPYLYENNYQLYSRTTEKDVVHINEYSKVPSSFSLAGKVYKANSDELKPVKLSQKKKKSVLTLPNQKVPVPRNCTVSDMNDSEYCNQDSNRKTKTKKRSCPSNVMCRQRKAEYNGYNCYLNMDSSSTTLTKKCSKGKKTNAMKKKKHNREQQSNDHNNHQFNTHDMWSVLKSINKFQFKPSPPASEDSNSIFFPKNISTRRGFKNIPKSRKSTSYAETCRTEEFAYISSIEVDSRCPRSFSHSSSFDRITVINNEEDIENIFTAIQEKHETPTTHPASTNENINKRSHVDGRRQKKRRQKMNDLHSFNNDNKSIINVIVCSKSTSEESEPAIGKGTKKVTKNYGQLKQLTEIESKPIKQQIRSKISSVKNMNQSHKSLIEQHINSNTIENSRKVDKNQAKDYNKFNKVNILSKTPVKQLEISDTTEEKNDRSSKIMIEKSTLTDVKDITYIKYPLVIIGVHLFTSANCVSNGDPPKVTWINNDNYIDEEKMQQLIVKMHSVAVKNGRTMDKQKPTQKKKSANNTSENKHLTNSKPKETMKHNPIRQFRDSILQFLHKKSSVQSCRDDNKTSCNGTTCTTKSNANNINVAKLESNEQSQQSHTKDIAVKEQSSNVHNFVLRPSLARNPRTKGKWANDFVENVIKKIKNGIYYTRDLKDVNVKNFDVSTKEPTKVEASVNNTQSDINIQEENNNEIPVVTLSKKIASIKTIPGFDDDLPDIEVLTINRNKIEIKHFLTNITLQFDVLSADNLIERRKEPKNLLDNISGNANLFKCKTAILNPVLPEELCTVLPKMIHGLLATIKPKTSVLLPLKKLKKSQPKFIGAESMRPFVSLPDMNGAFGNSVNIQNKRFPFANFRIFNELTDFNVVSKDILPILRNPFWRPVEINTVHVRRMKHFSNREIMCTKPSLPTSYVKEREKCRDLVPYDPKSMWLQSQSGTVFVDRNDFFRILGYLWTFYKKIMNAMSEIHSNRNNQPTNNFKNNVVSTNIHLCNYQMLNNNFFIVRNPLNKAHNAFHADSCKQINNLNGVKCIEYYGINGNEYCSDNSHSQHQEKLKKSRIKQKLKSKSISDIDCENRSKPLNKIINIEDFFELLGSKSLSSIFSEHVTKNILQCLIEMEDWTAEINSKQALLIVLLVNKKETPNLMRFKSILLQGIAVNRIALACELDMEIEVIEREYIEFSQYEGISYIPASIQNRDRLFEELHWIAKTTAADYQRPFDASAEKLLRSLLEKRKKLNPSYLRVMARYVGLGLLKLPNL